MATLRSQFDQALTKIEVNGDKAKRAIEAHNEIRTVLEADEQLRKWGVDTKLIGSYSRDAGIYPGKDVDVFVKFTELNTEATPKDVYNAVWNALQKKYGDDNNDGRARQQARSVKVAFPDAGTSSGASSSFSVDAVLAVHDGERWAIPTKDRNRWTASIGRWVTTDPERFGELSSDLSTSALSPSVGGRNAYKPIVKLMRQARQTHLGDKRPGGLYIEFATYEMWNSGRVSGDEWGDLFAHTLKLVAERLSYARIVPLQDPSMGTPVAPEVEQSDLERATKVFSELANKAEEALRLDDGKAAVNWREILGTNERAPTSVFPLPPGYDEKGNPVAGASSNANAAAGTGVSAGTSRMSRPREARSFG